MIFTKSILHYVKRLSCKPELYWPSGSEAEEFQMTPTPFLSFSDLDIPLKEELDLYLNKT
jgi:hypothetical protein